MVDVSSPNRTGRGRAGIRVHRGGTAHPCDLTVVEGIPCATVARTLLDLAGVIRRDLLQRACEQAHLQGLFNAREVDDVLARAVGRRGVARLRSVLGELEDEPAFTRSELERRFLALCRRNGLPTPAVNAWIELADEGFEVDFHWPANRLVVEVEGHRFHSSRWAFERDRRRAQKLTVAGFRVETFSWSQVAEEPGQVSAALRTLLAPAV